MNLISFFNLPHLNPSHNLAVTTILFGYEFDVGKAVIYCILASVAIFFGACILHPLIKARRAKDPANFVHGPEFVAQLPTGTEIYLCKMPDFQGFYHCWIQLASGTLKGKIFSIRGTKGEPFEKYFSGKYQLIEVPSKDGLRKTSLKRVESRANFKPRAPISALVKV